MNNTFQSQLKASAKRHKASTGRTINLIENPKERAFSIAWISTPVAMLAGVLLGVIITINIKKYPDFSSEIASTMVCDTIYVEADCDYEWLGKNGNTWCIMLPEVNCLSNRR